MSNYVKVFRCLVCNSLFEGELRVVYDSLQDAENALLNAPVIESLGEAHYCQNGNVGLALLAGFVIKITDGE